MEDSERAKLVRRFAEQYLWEMHLQKLAKRARNRTSLQYIKDRLEDMQAGMRNRGITQEVKAEVDRMRAAGQHIPPLKPSPTYQPHGVSKAEIRKMYDEAKARGYHVYRYRRLYGEIMISVWDGHPRKGGEHLWNFPPEKVRM